MRQLHELSRTRPSDALSRLTSTSRRSQLFAGAAGSWPIDTRMRAQVLAACLTSRPNELTRVGLANRKVSRTVGQVASGNLGKGAAKSYSALRRFPVRSWADGECTDVIELARLSWVLLCKDTREARSAGNP